MYGYEWTDQNGLYRLSVNSKTQKEIRPVFKEELDYFGFNEHWTYLPTKAPLLWAEGIRRYVLNGICVAETVGGGFYTKPTIKIYKEDPITVLVAPSWGPSSILNKFGSRILKALIATGYHIVVRPHPQSYTAEKDLIDNLMKEFPESEQLEWNRDNDNFDVLSRSNIMISDFSGVMFDFALVFNGPIIYADTSFDDSPYDAWWLDEETWTFKLLPKIGRQLTEAGIDSIKELIDDTIHSQAFRDGIEQARSEAWANIGNSAASIVDYLIKKENELTQSDTSASA